MSLIGSLLGGLGLFLLAVGMMTDGLRDAAGSSLRKILSDWTDTPFKAVVSGFFMTAIVQSSSAVTVASIGFVNAGLLSMRQALGIVYGSNVGTTITGWLVAFVGFKLNIQAFALPLIGIGMIIRLVKPKGREASLGMALVGFGLFFVGVDILKESFEGLVLAFDISKYTAEGFSGILTFLAIGLLMTLLTQSSSASIAITITAALSGVVGLYAAAAMIIGANVGTTSTAILASIGATANAKRVAVAQVIFNLGTGLVALLILPFIFLLIEFLSKLFGFSANVGVSLALFHTAFNVLGVALVLPLNNQMTAFLEKRFIAREEKLSLPKYLDKTIAATPFLAVNALTRELESIALQVNHLSLMILGANRVDSRNSVNTAQLNEEIFIVRNLSREVSKFIVSLERKTFSEDTSKHLATILRIDQYFLSCMNHIEHIGQQRKKLDSVDLDILDKTETVYLAFVVDIIKNQSESTTDESLLNIQSKHDLIKAMLLKEGAEGKIAFEVMLNLIDFIGEVLIMVQQWLKALKHLNRIQNEIGTSDLSDNEDSQETTVSD
tara:strand:- start:1473 stop:3131 length:1659 start_codon:yes stop_codon:yes gene_type:complete